MPTQTFHFRALSLNIQNFLQLFPLLHYNYTYIHILYDKSRGVLSSCHAMIIKIIQYNLQSTKFPFKYIFTLIHTHTQTHQKFISLC